MRTRHERSGRGREDDELHGDPQLRQVQAAASGASRCVMLCEYRYRETFSERRKIRKKSRARARAYTSAYLHYHLLP